jgi:hypothetical protein
MKTLTPKIWYLMILTMLSALVFSCTKDRLPETISPSADNAVKSNMRPDDIKNWLESKTGAATSHKNNIISKVLQNAVFDKMYIETLHDNENLIIIPLKQEYFSQHVNSKNPHPIQYLLLVENAKGEIRRGDIVLFNSANQNLKTLPKNAFHDFFNEDTFPADGTFTVITLGDVKEFEMDYKGGQKAQFRVWQGKQNKTQRDGEYCTSWYLVTTTYYSDGHTEVDWEYLGDTCSSCAPNQLCDHIDGDGGGPGVGDPGTPVSRAVEFIVKEEATSYEHWTITGNFTISGVQFTDATNNFFTGIASNGAVCQYARFPLTQSPNLSRYSIFTSSHSEGLTGNTTAWGNIQAHMYYPNWPGAPKTDNYPMAHVWQASTDLF